MATVGRTSWKSWCVAPLARCLGRPCRTSSCGCGTCGRRGDGRRRSFVDGGHLPGSDGYVGGVGFPGAPIDHEAAANNEVGSHPPQLRGGTVRRPAMIGLTCSLRRRDLPNNMLSDPSFSRLGSFRKCASLDTGTTAVTHGVSWSGVAWRRRLIKHPVCPVSSLSHCRISTLLLQQRATRSTSSMSTCWRRSSTHRSSSAWASTIATTLRSRESRFRDAPVTFGFLNSAITDPGVPIELPPFTREVDWEVELAIVIGRGGADILRDQAMSAVAGYTIVNDLSARDIQLSEGQWGRAKSFDTFKPMGPWITTTDELGSAEALGVKLWVNDEIKQDSSTAQLIFDVPTLVSRLSASTTLRPGMVISTGTPHGVGFARKPPEYLRPGDIVTLEIEGIGRLTNPVVAG